jgi:hypothetical protein
VTDAYGVQSFIRDYPGMRIAPSRGSGVALRGAFEFSARPSDGEEIRDCYELEVHVPRGFPAEIPSVAETGRRIPRSLSYHIGPDGALCLGSPLRLREIIARRPTLNGFAENCLVPYLYAASHKLTHGGAFLFGELAHGKEGIVGDYAKLLGLEDPAQAIRALELLGMKRRLANRAVCPCGCGRRLGQCSLNLRLGKLREVASREWFRAHAAGLRR